MISVRRRSAGLRLGDSANSCPAWLIAPNGLRISWAILAVNRPSDASFICCACRVIFDRSSRKIRVVPPSSPRCRKLGFTTGQPGATFSISSFALGSFRHRCSCCINSGAFDAKLEPCCAAGISSSSLAVSFIILIESFSSIANTPVRMT